MLHENLLTALKSIDNQIAREMQRDPKQRESHGVEKWAPYSKRVESITGSLLSSLGEGEIALDGLLVLAQALAKTLSLAVEDLGTEGLGKIRSKYCLDAFERIEKDIRNGRSEIHSEVN